MKKFLYQIILLGFLQPGILAQSGLLTVAEHSDYTSTATSLEVNAFLSELVSTSVPLPCGDPGHDRSPESRFRFWSLPIPCRFRLQI